MHNFCACFHFLLFSIVLFSFILFCYILFYFIILFLFCYLVPINSHLYLAWHLLFLKVLQTDSGGYKVAPQLKIKSDNTHTDRDIDILTPAALNAALVKLRAICAYKLNY